MADVIFIAALVAFFLLAALLVVACDRIIGPAEVASTVEPLDQPEEVAV
jgi:hypothetical protein